MIERQMDELAKILHGSKQYTFEYSDYGFGVLVLTNYNTGATVKIDLGKLFEEHPEVVEETIVNEEDEDYE